MPDTLHLPSTVFFKTETGQQEIQTRSLGLSPLVRRILVLADGKKSGAELAAFLPSADGIHAVLEQLVSQGCLRAESSSQTTGQTTTQANRQTTVQPASAANTPASSDAFFGEVADLPPAQMRSAKDNEMARNFMINSTNSIMGQQTRIPLIAEITMAQTTEQLRKAYIGWQASMADHTVGKRRLPELTEKLFKVL